MTITDERMALIELVDPQADGNLVREMLAFAAELIMEAKVALGPLQYTVLIQH